MKVLGCHTQDALFFFTLRNDSEVWVTYCDGVELWVESWDCLAMEVKPRHLCRGMYSMGE